MYHTDLLLTKAMLTACCQEAQRLGRSTWHTSQALEPHRQGLAQNRGQIVRQVGHHLVRLGTKLEGHGLPSYDFAPHSIEA